MAGSGTHKNQAAEFYRFLFTCIVFILHFREYGNFAEEHGQFNGGYLCVEFFFILSGFFLARHVLTHPAAPGTSPEREAAGYFLGRFCRLMPMYWISLAVLMLEYWVMGLSTPAGLWREGVALGWPELLACQIFWRPGGLNPFLWFVSALLWGSALVFYLLRKWPDFSLYILFPLGLLIFCGAMYTKFGYLDRVADGTLRPEVLLRAVFELGFGCVLYEVWCRLRERRFPPLLMTALEAGLTAAVLYIMWNVRRDQRDFTALFLLGALVLVVMLRQGWLSQLLDNRLSGWLGAACYPVYLNQVIFQQIPLRVLSGFSFWPTTAVLLVFSFLGAHIELAVLHRLWQWWKVRRTPAASGV